MAPGKTEKKRKAATTSAATVTVPPTKKSKRSDDKPSKVPAESGASPAQKKSAVTTSDNGVVSPKSLKLNGEAARKIKPRKRAADFLSDDEGDVENDNSAKVSEVKRSTADEKSKTSKKKAKKDAVVDTTAVKEASALDTVQDADDAKPQSGKRSKGAKEGKGHKKVELVDEPASDDAENDAREDDQTLELIKGFESSGDEDISGDEGFEAGQPVPTIPDSKKTKRKLQKMAKKRDTPEEPGAVYVGRIPHGFYEKEMRAYFSQFGPITRLRLSRNRVTGKSKHYAYIEFSSTSVAKIVAESMDNYLMFGHILKCKFVPLEQLHPETWKGANRRFNMTPWNKIEQRRLEAGKTREKWSKNIVAEQGRRDKKAEKLKAIGYEFELPELKGVEEVPVQEKPAALEDAAKADDGAEAGNAGEIEAADTEKATTGKSRKRSKKNKEVAKLTDEAPAPVKEPEVDGTPKPDRKKRVADADDTKTSKKAKKAAPKDNDTATPENPSKKKKKSEKQAPIEEEISAAKAGKKSDKKVKKVKA